MNGFYIWNNDQYQVPQGEFTVPDKTCIELTMIGAEPGDSFPVWRRFGPSCDQQFMPASECCVPIALSADCSRVVICEQGTYWLDVDGSGPDGEGTVTPPVAGLMIYAEEQEVAPGGGNGGCSGCG